MQQSGEMLELEQRQRIFEEIIIDRVKVIQDFVKGRYGKLWRGIREIQKNTAVPKQEDGLKSENLKA